MASVLQIGDRWRAQIRRPGRKSISKTFATKKEADAWARRTETALDQQKAALVGADITVLELVAEYRRMREELGRPVDPTTNTHYMLQHLEEDLGPERVADLALPLRAGLESVRRMEAGVSLSDRQASHASSNR